MKALIAMVIAACLSTSALAQSPYGDQFAAGNLQQYLEGAQSLKAGSVAFGPRKGATGKKCMGMRGGVAVTFKTVPVNANTKYTLSFRGTFTGGESIEENPRMQLALLHDRNPNSKRYDFLPKMKMIFLDPSGKTVSVMNHRALPFREWHDYNTTFYPPIGAASMQLVISSGTNTTGFYLDNMRFDKTPDQGALNVNPVVSESGMYDYSAWASFAAGAGMIPTADGSAAFNSAYGSTSVRFPMKGNTEYVIRPIKGKSLGYATTCEVRCLNKDNKRVGSMRASTSKDARFTTPVDCVSGVIHVRSFVLEEIRVLEAK